MIIILYFITSLYFMNMLSIFTFMAGYHEKYTISGDITQFRKSLETHRVAFVSKYLPLLY